MTIDEMEDLLERLGIEPLSVRGNEIQARCPGHKDRTGKEDHNPSWFINTDTGAHICFSCHFKGGVSYLIGYVNKYFDSEGNIDFTQSNEWLKSQDDLGSLLDKALTVKIAVEDVVKIDPAMLHAFTTPPDYALQSRGLKRSSAIDYGIRWDDRKRSWIIPIYDNYDGSLLGWQEKAFQGRFFKNYPAGMKKSNSVFGLGNYQGGDLIVVESPLDAVRLSSVGIDTGVAIYGSFISQRQVNLLKSADRLIFAFDNDEAGRDATMRMLSTLQDMWFEAWFFDYSHTDQKDVGGMSKMEILEGLTNARHCVAMVAEGVR